MIKINDNLNCWICENKLIDLGNNKFECPDDSCYSHEGQ